MELQQLLELCKRNADGTAYAYLRAGCDYSATQSRDGKKVELAIQYKGFMSFEGGDTSFYNVTLDLPEEYNREKLLEICEKSFVTQPNWSDRDSAEAQAQLGELYLKLLRREEFTVHYKWNTSPNDRCVTDDRTIYIDCLGDLHYLPTESRLLANAGKDWY